MNLTQLADMAKLEISEERLKTLEKEMESMVKMVENMPEIEDARPPAPLMKLREDVVVPSFPREDMLAATPRTANGLIVAPKTLEE